MQSEAAPARATHSPRAPKGAPPALLAGVKKAYSWTADLAFVEPGTILQGPDGTTLRVRADGGADELNAVPRRWSISADPTATRAHGTSTRVLGVR